MQIFACFADQSFTRSFVFNEYYSCIRSKVVAPTLAPSGPLPLAVVKESAVQVRFLGLIFLSKIDLFLKSIQPLKAKLLEGDLGAKCSAGKYAAALLNEMGKQVLLE